MGVRIVLVVLAAALAKGIFIAKEECPPNEEYLLCGSSCPFNCTNPEGPVTCSDDCVEGCFCKSGFLRNDNGTCVGADQCISKNPICDANEEFLSCGSACVGTCSQPEPLICGGACSMGCFCKSGFVRDTTSNKCIALDKCPVACVGNCSQPEPLICGGACSMGCFCKTGFVRDTTSNKCIALDKCPVEKCFNQNEVYDICNGSCEPSCSDPEPICTKLCTGGCICSSGLLRDDNGECVTVDKCPASNSTDPGLLGKYLNAINKILHLSTEA